MLRSWRTGRLAKPDQSTSHAAFWHAQQRIEGPTMRIAERAGQRLIHQTRPARQRFTRNALDDIECREDDALLPQPLDQSFSEDDAAVGLRSVC